MVTEPSALGPGFRPYFREKDREEWLFMKIFDRWKKCMVSLLDPELSYADLTTRTHRWYRIVHMPSNNPYDSILGNIESSRHGTTPRKEAYVFNRWLMQRETRPAALGRQQDPR